MLNRGLAGKMFYNPGPKLTQEAQTTHTAPGRYQIFQK